MQNAVGSVPYAVIVKLQSIIKQNLIGNFGLNKYN